MKKDFLTQLSELGFSEELIEKTRKRMPIGHDEFTMCERKNFNGHELKIVAYCRQHLEKKVPTLKLYHVIDVSPGYRDKWLPSGLPELVQLHKELASFDFNHDEFIRSIGKRYEYGVGRQIKANILYDKLNWLNDDKNRPAWGAKVMLKANYVQDTIFATHRYHMDGDTKNYDHFFPVLTIDKTTGLIQLDEAIDRLVNKNITNKQSEEKRTAAIAFVAEKETPLSRHKKPQTDISPQKSKTRRKR
jgi:hypothetical protein